MLLNIKDLTEKARYIIKIPFIIALITLGFLLEFLISVPFMVLCELDQRFRKKA